MSSHNGYDKISLIKVVRQRTGCNLRDAKEAVEEADGDLDAALRIVSQRVQPPSSNGQLQASGMKRFWFSIPNEGAVIRLQKSKIQTGCHSCGKEDSLSLVDLILANSQVSTARLCSRCVNAVYRHMDLIALFMSNSRPAESDA